MCCSCFSAIQNENMHAARGTVVWHCNSVIKIDALHMCQGELVTLNLRLSSRLVSCGLQLEYGLDFVKVSSLPRLFFCLHHFITLWRACVLIN